MAVNDSTTKSFSKVGKISSLQTMRLFASLGVFQYHLWQNYLGVQLGLPSTDYFLVLVGVLTAVTQVDKIGKINWWAYMRARYVRLYVTFILLFLLALAFKWGQADWKWILQSFFFIPIADRAPVIGATWMVSHFILFYLVVSIAFAVRRESVLWGVFLIWAVGIVAFNFFRWQTPLPPHWEQTVFYERNLEFIFGYIAGRLLSQNRISIPWGRLLFWVGTAGIVLSIVLQNNGINSIGRSLYTGIPIVLFILGLVSMEKQGAQDGVVKLLTLPWLVFVGEASYVLYLSHGIILNAWDRIFSISVPMVPLITVVVILASVIGYIFWERPVLTYLNKGIWTFPKFPKRPGLVEDTQPS